MLDFSPEKMVMIFFIAMLVLGPEKLPEIARKMGKLSAELRKLSGGFQNEIKQAVNDATSDKPLPEATSTSNTQTSSPTSGSPTSDSSASVVSAGDASKPPLPTSGQKPAAED